MAQQIPFQSNISKEDATGPSMTGGSSLLQKYKTIREAEDDYAKRGIPEEQVDKMLGNQKRMLLEKAKTQGIDLEKAHQEATEKQESRGGQPADSDIDATPDAQKDQTRKILGMLRSQVPDA